MKGIEKEKQSQLPLRTGLALYLVLALCLSGGGAAQAARAARTLNAQEWIVRELAQGRAVDVGDGQSETYEVSAEFLKGLLTLSNNLPGQGIWITGLVVTNQLDLRNAEVKQDVRLTGCIFKEDVLLNGCEFAKGLMFQGCEFDGRFIGTEMRVRRSLDFSSRNLNLEAVPTNGPAKLFFLEETSLAPARREGQTARRVRRAPGAVYWKFDGNFYGHRPTTFTKGADFELAEISGKLSGDGADFKAKVNFRGIKVGGTCWLENAVFRDEAGFAYANIGDQFSLQEASFTHPKRNADFYQLNCGGLMNLNGASFFGPANFIQTSVKGNLMAQDAWFLNETDLARIDGADFHHNADFGSLQVGGFAFFNGTRFAGSVSFRNAHFQSVFWDEVVWPSGASGFNAVRLEWMHYERLRATHSFTNSEINRSNLQWQQNHVETWTNLQAMLAQHAPYSADVYASLEQFFQRDGDEKVARDVYVESREQERKKVLWTQLAHGPAQDWWGQSKGLALYLESLLLKVVVGHGRHPEWALGWCALFVLFGCYVFRFENMEPEQKWPEVGKLPHARSWLGRLIRRWGLGSKHCRYYAFWYSLDMFVPLIELDGTKGWVPRPSCRLAWNYLTLHRLIGAILIPLGFAAFSGIVK